VPDPNGGPAPWKFSEALAWQLCQLQRPDGSWANPHDFMREDEPIVATSFALLALCRFDRSSAGIFQKIGDKIAPRSVVPAIGRSCSPKYRLSCVQETTAIYRADSGRPSGVSRIRFPHIGTYLVKGVPCLASVSALGHSKPEKSS
jgi:hypothetical protein